MMKTKKEINLKTTTLSSFTIIVMIIIAISIACSTDDDETDFYLSNLEIDKNIRMTRFGDENVYYIPDELIGSTGCAYKSLQYVFKEYSLDSIKNAMIQAATSAGQDSVNLENYPKALMASAIHNLTGKPVGTIVPSANSQLSIYVVNEGDIICVNPIEYQGLSMTTGHCSVITSIENKGNFHLLHCYDGCSFDLVNSNIGMIIRTSQM